MSKRDYSRVGEMFYAKVGTPGSILSLEGFMMHALSRYVSAVPAHIKNTKGNPFEAAYPGIYPESSISFSVFMKYSHAEEACRPEISRIAMQGYLAAGGLAKEVGISGAGTQDHGHSSGLPPLAAKGRGSPLEELIGMMSGSLEAEFARLPVGQLEEPLRGSISRLIQNALAQNAKAGQRRQAGSKGISGRGGLFVQVGELGMYFSPGAAGDVRINRAVLQKVSWSGVAEPARLEDTRLGAEGSYILGLADRILISGSSHVAGNPNKPILQESCELVRRARGMVQPQQAGTYVAGAGSGRRGGESEPGVQNGRSGMENEPNVQNGRSYLMRYSMQAAADTYGLPAEFMDYISKIFSMISGDFSNDSFMDSTLSGKGSSRAGNEDSGVEIDGP